NTIEDALLPLASQQPVSSSTGQHAPCAPAVTHSRPSGHVVLSPSVQLMLHSDSSPADAHVFESQSPFPVHEVPRPCGPNGCAMQLFMKHMRPSAQSASVEHSSCGTCSRRNPRSASVRVSAPNCEQF